MIDRIRRLGADLASLAGLRVELFSVELREQFDHWLRTVVLALAAVVLGCIGLGFVAVLVTVAFWDSHPLLALAAFALLFLGAAAWCARALSAAAAATPAPFEATIAEFRKDRRALEPGVSTDESPAAAAGLGPHPGEPR